MKKLKIMAKISVIIADDHQVVSDGISSFLSEIDEIESIIKVSDGKELLQKFDILKPDLVISDIEMPGLNGFEACSLIKKKSPETKVIILSMHKDYGLIKKLIDQGIDGYVSKNDDKEDFLNAIRSIIKGKKYFSQDVVLSLADKNDATPDSNSDFEKLSLLTERERDILKLICEGFSNKEIAAQLFISHRTVDTHRTNIMAKLDLNNVVQLTRFAIRTGLCN